MRKGKLCILKDKDNEILDFKITPRMTSRNLKKLNAQRKREAIASPALNTLKDDPTAAAGSGADDSATTSTNDNVTTVTCTEMEDDDYLSMESPRSFNSTVSSSSFNTLCSSTDRSVYMPPLPPPTAAATSVDNNFSSSCHMERSYSDSTYSSADGCSLTTDLRPFFYDMPLVSMSLSGTPLLAMSRLPSHRVMLPYQHHSSSTPAAAVPATFPSMALMMPTPLIATPGLVRKMKTPSPGLDQEILNFLASVHQEEMNMHMGGTGGGMYLDTRHDNSHTCLYDAPPAPSDDHYYYQQQQLHNESTAEFMFESLVSDGWDVPF
jgi:hypothetical protein